MLPSRGQISSASRPSQLMRLALTKAIESKAERMASRNLVELATTLRVALPAATKARRRREQEFVPQQAAAPEGRALQGGGVGPAVSAAEGGRLPDAITTDDEAADRVEGELVGAGELAQRLSIARGTLDNWRKAGRIIALRKGLRNFVHPLRQFDRRPWRVSIKWRSTSARPKRRGSGLSCRSDDGRQGPGRRAPCRRRPWCRERGGGCFRLRVTIVAAKLRDRTIIARLCDRPRVLAVDRGAPVRPEVVELRVQRLAVGADSGVADAG